MNNRLRLPGPVSFVMVILAIGQLACFAPFVTVERFPTPTPTSSAIAVPPVTGFAPSGDPKADLLFAYQLQEKTYPQQITETSTNSSSAGSTVRVTDSAGPGEQHVTWNLPESGEMIETGGMFYLFLGGQWSKSDMPPLDIPTEVDLARYFANGLTDAQYLGTDSSIGVEAYLYSYTTNLEGHPGSGQVWLGTADGLPYKATYQSTSGTYTFTAELMYEYGLEVTITAPIP